jgi:2-polyprenyl-3-methyl-5-hydroxy-6-metoxy-1,4-benzoquinol methylase
MIDLPTLQQMIPADAPWKPLLNAMFTRSGWLMKPMLEMLDEAMLPAYFTEFAMIADTIFDIRPIDRTERIDEVIKGLQFHSIEFLKLQIQFAKTGQYKSSDYDKVYEQVYAAGAVMQRYLDGLLLTYIAWPNHYRLLNWYKEKYLAVGPYGKCLEIGPGHGWLALLQLQANAANTLVGRDISPHSVEYTNSVLKARGVDSGRYDVHVTDAQRGLDTDVAQFDRVVIAEVIEHLPDPGSLLKSLVGRSHSRTRFFLTTVVNIEAPDHIHLFTTLEEVRALMNQSGLRIVDELDLPLNMNIQLPKPAYEVALVCEPIAAK